MRVFIAIDIPLELKNKLAATQEIFKKCDLAFRWVRAENIHLTLKFLGNIDEEQIDEIKTIITEVATEFKSFEVTCQNFGFFPNEKRPRVFFVSTTKEDILKSIAESLEEKLREIGFPKEGRFKSHLTLARIKTAKNIDYLKEKLKSIRLEETFLINEIVLYKSTLTPSGPIYEKIASSNLTA